MGRKGLILKYVKKEVVGESESTNNNRPVAILP